MKARHGLLVVVLLAAPALARATEEFPRVIENELGMPGPPPCTVCHLADMQARYSVHTPFGESLRVRGLVPADDDSLRRALDLLRTENVDSDGDDISDTDELVAGTDPNLPEGLDPMPSVSYGCAAAGRTGTAGAWLLAIAVGLVLVRRRVGR